MRPSDFQAFIAAEGYQAVPNFKKARKALRKERPVANRPDRAIC